MAHELPLISILAIGLSLAFFCGLIAVKLRIPPIVGYLLAGVMIGPHTPGFTGNLRIAEEFSEIGVVLLMFGVGLHFSLKDLMAVRKIAIPGALVQIGVAIVLGMGLASLLGWSLTAGFVFGLALSVASTVVLLRALQERRILETDRGKIAVGWLVVEDLVMVLALVLLPALAGGGGNIGMILLITVAKVVAFIAFMLVVGRRVIPWVLHWVAHSGSRELFRLSVLAIALGVAFGAAMLFGVSFALGAFFAGMILAESELSQRAAEETLPLRDAFAVLFFVSVGMLFNPFVLVEEPLALLGTLAIIVLGKSIAAFLIVKAFGRSNGTALTISASLAQIGEFSFILATLGSSLNLIPPDARDLILAGAIISIMLNPLLFYLIFRKGGEGAAQAEPASASGHVIIVGFGRVGRTLTERLGTSGGDIVIVEQQGDCTGLADMRSTRLVEGNAASADVLKRANIAQARLIFVAIPQSFEAGQIVEQARKLNPAIRIVARAHSDEEVNYLEKSGADLTVMGEREIAGRMAEQALGTA